MSSFWTKDNNYYNYKSELGKAQVEEILSDKWRWEAYSNNDLQLLELDCWWGITSSLEEAKEAAEKELLRWQQK